MFLLNPLLPSLSTLVSSNFHVMATQQAPRSASHSQWLGTSITDLIDYNSIVPHAFALFLDPQLNSSPVPLKSSQLLLSRVKFNL